MIVPRGCIVVSSSPLIGLGVAGVFAVLLCTCKTTPVPHHKQCESIFTLS